MAPDKALDRYTGIETKEGPRTLQFNSTFAHKLGQILKVVAGRDAEAADEILCCSFQVSVSIITRGKIIFRTAKVSVAGDGRRSVELSKSVLGFGLCGRVESFPSEELIGRDSFLGTES